MMQPIVPTRRNVLLGLGATCLVVATRPLPAWAGDLDTASAITAAFGTRPRPVGKVTLKLPTLAETGNSVPLTCTVDSPMTETDRVVQVMIFANRNPRPVIATMTFGPKAGKAVFSTNMRLSGTQSVIAIAEMADKSLWSASVQVVVTVGACDTLQSRY